LGQVRAEGAGAAQGERAAALREVQSSGFGPAHRKPDLHVRAPAKP